MEITASLKKGLALGLQYVTGDDLEEDETEIAIIIDFFIFTFVLTWYKEDPTSFV